VTWELARIQSGFPSPSINRWNWMPTCSAPLRESRAGLTCITPSRWAARSLSLSVHLQSLTLSYDNPCGGYRIVHYNSWNDDSLHKILTLLRQTTESCSRPRHTVSHSMRTHAFHRTLPSSYYDWILILIASSVRFCALNLLLNFICRELDWNYPVTNFCSDYCWQVNNSVELFVNSIQKKT
jgi:hypothetical protein